MTERELRWENAFQNEKVRYIVETKLNVKTSEKLKHSAGSGKLLRNLSGISSHLAQHHTRIKT